MLDVWAYTLLSVIIVSLISLIGLVALSIKINTLKKILLYLVSLSAGALFGDAFIHLLPEAVEASGFELIISIYVLSGIVIFLIVEKIIKWRHCHIPTSKEHPHSFAYMNLFGDGVHNFIDGLIIGGSYLVNIQVGIATTLAVILHEIPQEIGDFGVLIHGGFTRGKALFMNFLSAITAIIGAIVALALSAYVEGLTLFLLSFAAGSFIYIAGSDLIPELHKEQKLGVSILHLIVFIIGIVIMFGLLFLE
jgi:zinc and cadmium transporter